VTEKGGTPEGALRGQALEEGGAQERARRGQVLEEGSSATGALRHWWGGS